MAELFESCIEKLLAGEVIGSETTPQLMRYLEDSENLKNVNIWLMQIKRLVAQTQDKRGFYCVYANLDDESRKRQIRSQFDEALNDFNGLVDWLRLCRSISHDARPLEAGDILRESELLAAIENSNTLSSQLERIADKFQRAKKSVTTNNRLRSVLEYLTTKGFFCVSNASGSVYIATAKWSLLYDELEFIASCERFEEIQDNSIQTELF
ncbi:MAG: hypothetical protein Q4E81_07940 [Succinatimonas sp.]|nr:hypothetical protein [Succinatimonas sp.]